MSLVDLDVREDATAAKQAARATDKLLALMCKHHPEYGFKAPKKQEPEPEPDPVVEPVKHPFWFWMEIDPAEKCWSHIDRIQKAVCRYYGVTKTDLTSERRDKEVIRPRHVAIYLCKSLTGQSLPKIGRKFGGRDHSTALNAIRNISQQLPVDAELAFDVAHLEARLEEVLQ